MSYPITETKRGLVTTLSIKKHDNMNILSNPISIDDSLEVWLRFFGHRNACKVFISVQSHTSALTSTVKLNVICNQLNFSKQLTSPQYILLGQFNIRTTLDITLLASKTEPITFPKLYEDTDFTDFYLSSEEGRVAVHRTCFAAHRVMFKTMLLGEWNEIEEARVMLKGLTVQTLQQLKDYMYLGTLPEDVRQLLLLAKCYLLNNLKEDCMLQLASTATPGNLYEVNDFAFENSLHDLSLLLLQVATNEVVDGAYRNKREKMHNLRK